MKEEEIIIPIRDTLMKPFLVWPLLKMGMFSEYRDASQWVSKNTKPTIKVPKSSTHQMIELINRAGGKAFLAHPGYYILEKEININQMITELKPHGLVGLESRYPYYKTGPKFQTKESETEMIEFLESTARKHNILTSGGSDAHSLTQMIEFQSNSINSL